MNDIHNIDIIGDIHSCFDQLLLLLAKLGYKVDDNFNITEAPKGRRLVFVGDFADRGTEPIKVLKVVMNAVKEGKALSVRGNHDDKLIRKLKKRGEVRSTDRLHTLDSIENEGEEFKNEVINFLEALPYQLILDDDKLVIAHAGMSQELQGKVSNHMKAFAIFGDTTGQTDEQGYPILKDWAAEYSGHRAVIYGHETVEKVVWRNNTIDIDSGCFTTGILTAVRWPEREIISVRG